MADVEFFSSFDTVFRVRCSKVSSISTTDRAPPTHSRALHLSFQAGSLTLHSR